MKPQNFGPKTAIAAALLWGLVGCSGAPETTESVGTASAASATGDPTTDLTISVAASVQDAMKDVQAAYQEEAPAIAITYNFGSSGSLAQQITQGAPADIYLSASQKWMDDLEEKGEILDGSRRNLLQNSMVAIAAQGNEAIAKFDDFKTDAVQTVAIGEPESVPAGRYAREVLDSLGLFDTLQPKLVFGKDVRQVLSYVETGNADVGLVYATDANISDRVRTIAVAPPETHAPISYPIAIVGDSENAEAARNFIDFLASEVATNIFEEYGFEMAEPIEP